MTRPLIHLLNENGRASCTDEEWTPPDENAKGPFELCEQCRQTVKQDK